MDKFTGNYKADVVDNVDPKGSNRVKIRVRGLMDGIPKTHLPFAKYVSPTPAGKDTGSAILPANGTRVWTFFGDGDINDPYYFGGVVEDKDDLPKSVKKGRHILFQSPDGGTTIAFNDVTNQIEIKTGKYNTTLDQIIDALLAHGHISGAPGAPTTNTQVAPPPLGFLALNFKTGTL